MALVVPLVLAIASACAPTPAKSHANDWIRTELFFGLTENARPIPSDQWQDFVDQSITPRFPDGLTIVYASGQWRSDTNGLVKEPTAILILLHKKETLAHDDAMLRQIAREYDARFHQEAVLKSDSDARVEFVTTQP